MKTLIIYASTYDNAKDCVEQLKKQLEGEVCVANVMSDTMPCLDAFDNIIIGGSIYMGHIQKKLKIYCNQNLKSFVNKRLALFLCCGLPENFEQSLKNAFPHELLKKATAKECFGGELRTDRMNFAHKMISGLMKKIAAKEGKSEVRLMSENISSLAVCMNNI